MIETLVMFVKICLVLFISTGAVAVAVAVAVCCNGNQEGEEVIKGAGAADTNRSESSPNLQQLKSTARKRVPPQKMSMSEGKYLILEFSARCTCSIASQ